jgi:hypothetical protein
MLVGLFSLGELCAGELDLGSRIKYQGQRSGIKDQIVEASAAIQMTRNDP